MDIGSSNEALEVPDFVLLNAVCLLFALAGAFKRFQVLIRFHVPLVKLINNASKRRLSSSPNLQPQASPHHRPLTLEL